VEIISSLNDDSSVPLYTSTASTQDAAAGAKTRQRSPLCLGRLTQQPCCRGGQCGHARLGSLRLAQTLEERSIDWLVGNGAHPHQVRRQRAISGGSTCGSAIRPPENRQTKFWRCPRRASRRDPAPSASRSFSVLWLVGTRGVAGPALCRTRFVWWSARRLMVSNTRADTSPLSSPSDIDPSFSKTDVERVAGQLVIKELVGPACIAFKLAGPQFGVEHGGFAPPPTACLPGTRSYRPPTTAAPRVSDISRSYMEPSQCQCRRRH